MKPLERQESRKQDRPASGAKNRAGTRRPADEAYLERAAAHYLARFASSVGNFKDVLWRKVERRGLADGVEKATAQEWIDRIAERFVALGLLNDEVFAHARAGSLLRRGKPRRVIRAALVAKGVTAEMASDAVEALSSQSDDPDLDAAVAFARRKRLGPYGPTDVTEERHHKQLAAFARAGFSYQLARRVLRGEP
ncbi:regulatory protein RecX [Emcibacter sp. SYSU 3D8]|uniref:regulatory protein RecX n=1 Tax=Emcibacter sp. SYSU 3D8 TaxID=3133969 RepID=UPI0031FEB266